MDEDVAQLAQQYMATVPRLMHRLGSELRGHYEGVQISMAQFRALTMLRHGAHTLGELAAAHEVAPPTMSRLVSTLVERGWVSRQEDPSDRRQTLVSVTPTGEQVWQSLRVAGTKQLGLWLARLTPAERVGLAAGLAGLEREMDD